MPPLDLSKVEQLFTEDGWSLERLRLGETCWAAAFKRFDSAGGARTAVVYLQSTQEGGLYVHGTYESAGEDALAGHLRLYSAQEVLELESLMPAYLAEAARRIEHSWGRRVMRASRSH